MRSVRLAMLATLILIPSLALPAANQTPAYAVSDGYTTDPRGDVDASSSSGTVEETEPSVDITGWGVSTARADQDSVLMTLRVDTAARPKLDPLRGKLRMTLGPNEGPRTLWYVAMSQEDGSPQLWKWDGEGGWWEVGCPSMSGGIDDSGFGVTLDSECIKGPQRLVLQARTHFAGEDVFYSDDTEVLVVDLDASGGRLDVPGAVDTSSSCSGATGGMFSDTEGNIHERSIDCVSHLGITQGKGDGRYAPREALTRGQLATFIVRTLEAAGVAVPAPGEEHDFWEGDDGHRHERSINALTTMVMFHSATGTVDLDEIVDRAEMSLFLDAALAATRAWPRRPEPDYFHDDTHHAPDMVEGRINRVAAAGISGGKGDGRYAPDETLTRDAMATFLTRFHARLADADPSRSQSGWWKH